MVTVNGHLLWCKKKSDFGELEYVKGYFRETTLNSIKYGQANRV